MHSSLDPHPRAALAFGLASFAHAGALHAWIAFPRGAPGPRPGA